jgi:hypothetical protein
MKRENSNRTRSIHLHLTEQEYEQIDSRCKASTCRNRNEYIRKQIFNKRIVTTYRNESLDDLMEENIVLTGEVRAIGKSIHQIAKKVDSLKYLPELKLQLYLLEMDKTKFFDKMEEINSHTQKIAEQWLQ